MFKKLVQLFAYKQGKIPSESFDGYDELSLTQASFSPKG